MFMFPGGKKRTTIPPGNDRDGGSRYLPQGNITVVLAQRDFPVE
jgi:hypothetical protein